MSKASRSVQRGSTAKEDKRRARLGYANDRWQARAGGEEQVTKAIRKIAWVACEVNHCGGTRAKPCARHMAAATDYWRAVIAIRF